MLVATDVLQFTLCNGEMALGDSVFAFLTAFQSCIFKTVVLYYPNLPLITLYDLKQGNALLMPWENSQL